MPEDKNNEKRRSSSKVTGEISVCDVMSSNTSKIIRKMESKIPALLQMQSDLYTQYLHLFDDIFGTCYIAEKQFFDKFNIGKENVQYFNNYWSNLAEIASHQIDTSTLLQRASVEAQTVWIKSFDQHVHAMLDYYAWALSKFNIK